MKFSVLSLVIFLTACDIGAQKNDPAILEFPAFEGEQEIAITNYSVDAMEPFISSDGNTLFFNSLNDSVDTSVYYAVRTDDVTFDCKGKVSGVNNAAPHLDAVASMDDAGCFYFVSTRNYPTVFENLQCCSYANGSASGVIPAQGNFYVYESGWLIMDAEINRGGGLLYFVNARFTGGSAPSECRIGEAEKTQSGFQRTSDYLRVLSSINDDAYLTYAPSSSADGLELYFTRALVSGGSPEICVSVRNTTSDAFSQPQLLNIPGSLIEAPSISKDKQQLYYHKKSAADGLYHIYMMKRS